MDDTQQGSSSTPPVELENIRSDADVLENIDALMGFNDISELGDAPSKKKDTKASDEKADVKDDTSVSDDDDDDDDILASLKSDDDEDDDDDTDDESSKQDDDDDEKGSSKDDTLSKEVTIKVDGEESQETVKSLVEYRQRGEYTKAREMEAADKVKDADKLYDNAAFAGEFDEYQTESIAIDDRASELQQAYDDLEGLYEDNKINLNKREEIKGQLNVQKKTLKSRYVKLQKRVEDGELSIVDPMWDTLAKDSPELEIKSDGKNGYTINKDVEKKVVEAFKSSGVNPALLVGRPGLINFVHKASNDAAELAKLKGRISKAEAKKNGKGVKEQNRAKTTRNGGTRNSSSGKKKGPVDANDFDDWSEKFFT